MSCFFSIVIPLYNKESCIKSAIKSINEQIFRDFEIVIIDDGSTDNSYTVAQRALEQIEISVNRKLIHKENGGVSSARNRGVFESKGEYVVFLDADDLFLPNHLSELYDLITCFPDAKVYSTFYSILGCEGLCSPRRGVPVDFKGIVEDPFGVFAKGLSLMNSSTTCVQRGALIAPYIFPDGCHRGEDIHLWLRLLLKYPIAHSAKQTVIINHLADNRSAIKPVTVVPEYFIMILRFVFKKNSIDTGRNLNLSSIKRFYIKSALATCANAIILGNRRLASSFFVKTFSYGWISGAFVFLSLIFMPRFILLFVQNARRKKIEVSK